MQGFYATKLPHSGHQHRTHYVCHNVGFLYTIHKKTRFSYKADLLTKCKDS